MSAAGRSLVPSQAIGPFGMASMAASAVFLVLGLAWPQAAGALVRLFLATLAVGFVLARAYDALQPARSTDDPYSPFDGYDPGERRVAPWALQELTRRLRTADHDAPAGEAWIPMSVEQMLIDTAEQRLADGPGLRLRDPADRDAIRSRVSEPMWRLIRNRTLTDSGPSRGRPVPLALLESLLDELEQL